MVMMILPIIFLYPEIKCFSFSRRISHNKMDLQMIQQTKENNNFHWLPIDILAVEIRFYLFIPGTRYKNSPSSSK